MYIDNLCRRDEYPSPFLIAEMKFERQLVANDLNILFNTRKEYEKIEE